MKQQDAPQCIGHGDETLAKLLLSDEALQGLSVSDRLKQAGAVANILQKSPRLMRAIQMGLNLQKLRSFLDPTDLEIIERSPVLKRLAVVGMDAVRQGTPQAAHLSEKQPEDQQ